LDFKAAVKFRFDMVIGTGVNIIWLFFAIAPVLVAGKFLGDGDGWTQPRLLFLQAIWYWMDAIMWVFCFGSIQRLAEDVRVGTLDGQLLLPTSSLARTMLGHLSVQDLPKVVIALALGGYAIWAGAMPGGLWSILAFIVCLLAASVIFWCVAVFSSYKVMTLREFDGTVALNAMHNLGRMPVDMYGPILRIFLSSIFPVVLITTVPSRVFFGWSSWWLPLVSVAVAVVLVVVLRLAWNREVRNYIGLQN
jgi:ABC-2 type transport system permease protein